MACSNYFKVITGYFFTQIISFLAMVFENE